MNKYHQNIIAILFILSSIILFAYWLNLNFGYTQIILMITGGYGIYLNLKAIKEERINHLI